MKKSIKHTELYIGQLVVVTEHPETQVYTIAEFEGNNVLLQWREGTHQTRCTHDKFDLLKPTLQQIEYSIAANGALVSSRDVGQWA